MALKHLKKSEHEVHDDQSYSSFTDRHKIRIPYRVYFPSLSPSEIKHLPKQQRVIIASIMSRHHDGFQRESWIRELCSYPLEWTVPYIAYALGDYVVEVVSAIEASITSSWVDLFHSFKADSYIDSHSLSQRILTYWSIYYGFGGRRYTWLENYPSYRVANKLGIWDKMVARQLIRKQKKRVNKAAHTNPLPRLESKF